MFTVDFVRWIMGLGGRYFIYPLSGTVEPLSTSGSVFLKRVVQNDAHFLSIAMNCGYQTLAAGPADDGVNRLSMKIKDEGTRLDLTDDFVSLDTIAAPGRQRTPGVAGDPSLGLQIPGLPFLHLFTANGAIALELRNSGTEDLDVDFAFCGFKIPLEAKAELERGMVAAASQMPVGM